MRAAFVSSQIQNFEVFVACNKKLQLPEKEIHIGYIIQRFLESFHVGIHDMYKDRLKRRPKKEGLGCRKRISERQSTLMSEIFASRKFRESGHSRNFACFD